MAKADNPEPQKPAAPPTPEKKKKKEKPVKPKIEVPPVVDMVISFSKTTVLLISILVALISINSGSDLQTIFVRALTALIVSGVIIWLVSWMFTQQYLESILTQPKKDADGSEDGMMKDLKA